jgi:hypothetical protein
MKLYILLVARVALATRTAASRQKGILDDILESRGLLRGSGASMDSSEGGSDHPAQAHNEGDDPPSGGFARGSKVTINGLHAVALNGQTATVHGYDYRKDRYLVELHDGTPKEIKGEHLSLVGIQQQAASNFQPGIVPTGGIAVGTVATIFGLKSAVELNGQQVVVKGYDDKKQRYVVQARDGSPKEVKASHLHIDSDPGMSSQVQQPQAPAIAEASKNFREPMPVVPQIAPMPGPMEKTGSDSMPALKEGAQVTIVGMHAAKQLNGQTAVVHDVDVKSGRYMVELPDGSAKAIKRQNLLLPSELARVEALKNVATSPDANNRPLGPNGWTAGTQVLISGLKSAQQLNGQVGSVRAFDAQMQRYIVVLAGGGPPKKIKSQNLHLAASGKDVESAASHAQKLDEKKVEQPQVPQPAAQNEAPQSQTHPSAPSGQLPSQSSVPAAKPPIASSSQLVPGSHVLVSGLVSNPQLNGQVAVVHGFDGKTGRYIVEFSSVSKPKKIKESHLKLVDTPKMSLGSKSVTVTKPSQGVTQTSQSKLPRASVCNAYADHASMSVFLVSADGDSYMQLFGGLPYQGCTDVDLPDGANNATLEFVIDKFQVARQSLKGAKALKNPSTSLVLVVYRKSPNTLKAAVLANTVSPRDDLYTLLMFNAYRGTDLFEMRANRGGIVQELKLNKAYRLNKEQHLALTLTNGFHDLNLAFQPKKGRVYAAVCTGVAEGLKGEPRNLGIVVHELGDWTASEEMSDDAKEKEVNTPPPIAAIQEEEPQDTAEDSKPKKSGATNLVGQGFALWLGVVLLQF